MTATRDMFYVKVIRTSDDGSVTYKGAFLRPAAEREAAAWIKAFPDYEVTIEPVATELAAVRRWAKATRDGHRYVPERAMN